MLHTVFKYLTYRCALVQAHECHFRTGHKFCTVYSWLPSLNLLNLHSLLLKNQLHSFLPPYPTKILGFYSFYTHLEQCEQDRKKKGREKEKGRREGRERFL